MQDIIVHPDLMYFVKDTVSLVNSPPEDRDNTCLICSDELLQGQRLILHLGTCGNAYHKKCLLKWLKGYPTCPACKAEIMPTIKNILNVEYVKGGPHGVEELNQWLRKLRITGLNEIETQMTFVSHSGTWLNLYTFQQTLYTMLSAIQWWDPIFTAGEFINNTFYPESHTQRLLDNVVDRYEQAMIWHKAERGNPTAAAHNMQSLRLAFIRLLSSGYGEDGMYDHDRDIRYRPDQVVLLHGSRAGVPDVAQRPEGETPSVNSSADSPPNLPPSPPTNSPP